MIKPRHSCTFIRSLRVPKYLLNLFNAEKYLKIKVFLITYFKWFKYCNYLSLSSLHSMLKLMNLWDFIHFGMIFIRKCNKWKQLIDYKDDQLKVCPLIGFWRPKLVWYFRKVGFFRRCWRNFPISQKTQNCSWTFNSCKRQ